MPKVLRPKRSEICFDSFSAKKCRVSCSALQRLPARSSGCLAHASPERRFDQLSRTADDELGSGRTGSAQDHIHV